MKKLCLILFAMIIGCVSAFAEIYVVTATRLTVRTAPKATAKSLGVLEKGIELDVSEISEGFGKVNFFGKDGYVDARYLKLKSKVDNAAGSSASAKPETSSNEQTLPAPAEAAPVKRADETAIVYLFYDVKHYIKALPISVNGKVVCHMEGKESTSKMTGTRYEKSMCKMIVHGEGKMTIANDFTWADKPYHNEISLNVADGGVYYVKIYIENMFNAFTKKRTGLEMKQLSQKDGLKELKKKDKYCVNPDVDVDL